MKTLRTIAFIIAVFACALFVVSKTVDVSAEEGGSATGSKNVPVKGYNTDEGVAMADGYDAGKGNTARIEDPNGNTGYCIDPGYQDASSTTNCDVEDISGTAAGQLYGNVFNEAEKKGASDGELANALRMAAEQSGDARFNSDDTYKEIYQGKQGFNYNPDGGYDLFQSASKGSKNPFSGGISFRNLGNGKIDIINNTGGEATLDKAKSGLKGAFSSVLGMGSNILDIGGSADDCGQPVTPTVSWPSSNGSGNKSCNQVNKYTCGGSGTQDFIGCGGWTEPNPDTGDNESQMDNGTPQTIECPPDDDCPYEPEDFVDKIGGPFAGDGTADMLCDSGGYIAFIDQQATVTSRDLVDECALGDDVAADTKVSYDAPGESGEYCEMHCIEQYDFNTKGTIFSIPTEEQPITAGTYFNFNPKVLEIYDKVTISCYTINNIDYVMKDIENNYAKYKTQYNNYRKEVGKCNAYSECCPGARDEDGNCTSNCRYHDYTVTESTWQENYDQNWTFHFKLTPKVIDSGSHVSGECPSKFDYEKEENPEHNPPDYAGMASAAAKEIGDFNDKCVDIADEVQEFIQDCDKTVIYEYYDGDKLGITGNGEIKFKSEVVNQGSNNDKQLYCPQSGDTYNKAGAKEYDDCGTNKQPTKINIEGKNTTNIMATANVGATATKETKYTLGPVTINNDYSQGERSYSKDGTTSGNTHFEGWPVDYTTPQGRYRYKFIVDDIQSCLPNTYIKSAIDPNNDEYDINCVYEVNGCDFCPWWCDEDDVDNPDACEGHECNNSCIYQCLGAGCIYDSNGGLSINYQPISLINIDDTLAYLKDKYNSVLAVMNTKTKLDNVVESLQSDTDIAALFGTTIDSQNWDENGKYPNSAKAKATLYNIRRDKENIYDGRPEYSVTLDMQAINWIKNYNNDQENKFTINNMSCTNESGDYVVCYSKFLQELESQAGVTVNDATGLQHASAASVGVSTYDKNQHTGPAYR